MSIDGVEVTVSTVFLGINHQFQDGPPILWETLVFGPKDELDGRRYTSREAAIIGHNLFVKKYGGLVLEELGAC